MHPLETVAFGPGSRLCLSLFFLLGESLHGSVQELLLHWLPVRECSTVVWQRSPGAFPVRPCRSTGGDLA